LLQVPATLSLILILNEITMAGEWSLLIGLSLEEHPLVWRKNVKKALGVEQGQVFSTGPSVFQFPFKYPLKTPYFFFFSLILLL
jgi:hypothetical protein